MAFPVLDPAGLDWETRPHAPGEPARHVAELSETAGMDRQRANVWRYEPGARGRRHVHAAQEETFVVLAGTLTIALGESAERREVPAGSLVHVPAGTPLQSANLDGAEDLLVCVFGTPPDEGADVLPDAL